MSTYVVCLVITDYCGQGIKNQLTLGFFDRTFFGGFSFCRRLAFSAFSRFQCQESKNKIIATDETATIAAAAAAVKSRLTRQFMPAAGPCGALVASRIRVYNVRSGLKTSCARRVARTFLLYEILYVCLEHNRVRVRTPSRVRVLAAARLSATKYE